MTGMGKPYEDVPLSDERDPAPGCWSWVCLGATPDPAVAARPEDRHNHFDFGFLIKSKI